MLTGYGARDSTVESTKLGAFKYLEKPCDASKNRLADKKMPMTIYGKPVRPAKRACRPNVKPVEKIPDGILGNSPTRWFQDKIWITEPNLKKQRGFL